MFPAFPKLLRAGLLRRLDPEIVRAELMVQFEAFGELFGRAPDFVDGHQHAQLFPQSARRLSGGGEGGCARRLGSPMRRTQPPLPDGSATPKALLLDLLSAQFRTPRRARRHQRSIRALPAPMISRRQPDFGALMAAIPRRAAGGRRRHVSSRLRRRNPCQPRSAHGPARTRIRLSRQRGFPARCWPRTTSPWDERLRGNSPPGILSHTKI